MGLPSPCTAAANALIVSSSQLFRCPRGRANGCGGAGGLDSGLYSKAVLTPCRRAGGGFSVTARMDKAIQRAIVAIPEEAWVPIPHRSSAGTFGEDERGQPMSGADVAEVPYPAFGKKGMRVRLIVHRVRPTLAGGQERPLRGRRTGVDPGLAI